MASPDIYYRIIYGSIDSMIACISFEPWLRCPSHQANCNLCKDP